MRLDGFLSKNGFGSRKSVKKLILNSRVKVDNNVILDVGYKLNENNIITVDEKIIENISNVVLILNKPTNYISSLIDERYPSVINLIDEKYKRDLRLVGRLDYDTTGLLLLTDNGILNARLTSPKYHIEKIYQVKVNHLLKDELVEKFNQPNDIGRGEITRPAKLKIIDNYNAEITITEGKYHEIKRLFGKYNYDVIALNRISFGPIKLNDLEIGKYRKLKEEEYILLLEAVNMNKEEYLWLFVQNVGRIM